MVDSSDTNRIDEAKEVLKVVLANAKLANIPVLFFANKADQETAVDPGNVSVKFLSNDPKKLVQCCLALRSIGPR